MRVLYEDNHLIAVVKPAGLLTQSAHPSDDSLLEQVKTYLKETYHKPGNVFVGLLHRLDRNVGGIVLFAKTSKGASRLSEQIRNHTVEKMYHALVCGKLTDNKTLTHYLIKNEKTNTVTVVDELYPGAKKAALSYHVHKHGTTRSLIEVVLHTGRSHQIRAQLAAIGAPLLGDTKYGGDPLPGHGLCLYATSLSFTTATGRKRVVLTLAYPESWEAFL